MMFFVVKVGWPQFDALHALGLDVALTTISNLPVTIEDCSDGYILHLDCESLPVVGNDLLDKLFVLPAPETYSQLNSETLNELTWSNLDGLLAAIFTTPGVRALSVNDLIKKQEAAKYTEIVKGDVLQAGIYKAEHYIQRIKKWILKIW